jgi:hypothetical protein
MKTQMTALAAAVTITMSGMAFAQQLPLDNSVSWGVDNPNTSVDNDNWDNVAPAVPSASNILPALGSLAPTLDASQNVSNINQTGSGTSANQASVQQGGGIGNQSDVIQTKTSASGGPNETYVDQFGDDNVSYVIQDLSQSGLAETLQTGTNNQGRIEQLGAQNDSAFINQLGTDNKSVVQQGLGGGSSGNIATSTQAGLLHDSVIRQTGNGNNASATQLGVGGQSAIAQNRGLNQATYLDIGVDNTSYIRQRRIGSDGNTADVFQAGFSNFSEIGQDGSDNFASVDQLGALNNSDVQQSGDDNVALVAQASSNSDSVVNQNGDDNVANVAQTGIFGSNESYILQSGNNHEATVLQARGLGFGGANISTVTQVGAVGSSASVSQSGTGNWASTIQY